MANLLATSGRGERLAARPGVPEWALWGNDVARAVGIVSAQAGCSADHALHLLRECAHRRGRTLPDIVVAVLDRKLRFD